MVTAEASDADQASEAMSSVYGGLTVRAPARTNLEMRLRCVELSTVRLVTLNISSSAIYTRPYPHYTVATTLSGRASLTVSGATTAIPTRGATVIAPGRPLQVDYLDRSSRMLTVVLDRTALEDELSAMLGRTITSPIRFDPGPGTGELSNPFRRTLELLDKELSDPAGIAWNSVMSRHLSRLLMTGLLLGHRHAYSDELSRPAGFQGPMAIRAAVDAIEADPVGFTTVTDLARHVGLSVRALEGGFRKYLETSPMRHLRRVRLARAHEELLHSDSDSTTSTAIAHRWGFGHYGRFVTEYRATYGCTPAESMRANRRT